MKNVKFVHLMVASISCSMYVLKADYLSDCRVSEYHCANGQCIPSNTYCNGVDDCGDKSDEPPYCSSCNRTYYGHVGVSYDLEIRRPRPDRLPFLCYLNFTAAGGSYGDIIQVTFEKFTVGRFVSYYVDGCPDGYMTIQEENLPNIGGQWCGSGWGYTVYYSESSSINITLFLLKLANQGVGYHFDFKLIYKFLPKGNALIRYGNTSVNNWRGTLVNSTYCDRILEQCDTRQCRIQSPNFPGMYPRNVTCYYSVQMRGERLPGKQPLISVGQRHSHKIHIKDQYLKFDRGQRNLNVPWQKLPELLTRMTGQIYSVTFNVEGMTPVELELASMAQMNLFGWRKTASNCAGSKFQPLSAVACDDKIELKRVWDQCNVIQDYLTVYDGASTEDPILVRLCGGGAVPDIVSSGAHMLLEFHTSPYDTPFHPSLASYLAGFELGVQILYANVGSLSYVPHKRKCDFVISSVKVGQNWGYLENPVHSLPPNTTCRYHFQGRHHQNVWISFVKYYAASWDPDAYHLELECNAKMTIFDGAVKTSNGQTANVTTIGEFCKDETPKLCDHAMLKNLSGLTRPCASAESYVSSGTDLTLEIFLLRGSVLFPLNFKLRYEFVDTSLEGVRPPESRNFCDRVFVSPESSSTPGGKFYSPRSVFHYGRGGSRNLSCVFRFKPGSREKVHLRFISAKFGGRSCGKVNDTRGLGCVHNYEGATKNEAEISISEYVWPGVAIPRTCICSELKEPLEIVSLISTVLEVNFTIINMNVTEDFKSIFFEGDYHFVVEISPTDSDVCSKNRFSKQVRGSSGQISNREPRYQSSPFTNQVSVPVVNHTRHAVLRKCGNYPWLIEAQDDPISFLFLKVKGYDLTSSNPGSRESLRCPTLNRIVVYPGSDPHDLRVICPVDAENFYDHPIVEIFSNGWNGTGTLGSTNPMSRSFIIEFLSSDSSNTPLYSVSWLQVTKHLSHSSSSLKAACPYRCPELNACISSTLWCDNVQHCPSGFDENDINCMQFAVPIRYIVIGGGLLLLLTLLILCTSWCKYRQYRKKARQAEKLTALNNLHSNNIAHSVDIYCKRYSLNSDDLYLDGKDSLC